MTPEERAQAVYDNLITLQWVTKRSHDDLDTRIQGGEDKIVQYDLDDISMMVADLDTAHRLVNHTIALMIGEPRDEQGEL